MEKLSILVALANDKNVEQLLLELKEYASECVWLQLKWGRRG